MESTEGVSEEQLSNGRGKYYSPIFQIVDFDLLAHTTQILPVFYEAWLFIQGEDASSTRRITIKDKEYEVPEIEAILYWYLDTENSKIKIALYDNEIIGMMIYNPIVEGLFAIRLLYVRPESYGTKAGFNLISSLEKVKVIIFQTKKDIVPYGAFAASRGRQVKLYENEKTITWSMNWEKK